MTNKLVVVINSLKSRKIKKILLYEMKFLVRNYSCLQNPWLRGYCRQIRILCPQLNLLKPPTPRTKFLGTPLLIFTVINCNKILQLPPEPLTKGLLHPDPYPLSSAEFVGNPPTPQRTKFLGTPLLIFTIINCNKMYYIFSYLFHFKACHILQRVPCGIPRYCSGMLVTLINTWK